MINYYFNDRKSAPCVNEMIVYHKLFKTILPLNRAYLELVDLEAGIRGRMKSMTRIPGHYTMCVFEQCI
jgi:hypothetical protein